MKKTCNGCRAATGWGCGLGKKTKRVTKKFFGTEVDMGRMPTEECSKPKKYNDYLYLLETNTK